MLNSLKRRADAERKDAAEVRCGGAFAHLKTVPGISDGVLRLWTLYAESALGYIGGT
jgi:hypothetical protein